MKHAFWAVVLLGLMLPAQAVAFGHEGGLPGAVQDVNARDLHVLAYHPQPDPEGDPWGVGYADTPNGTIDYMAARYDSYLYPTAVFDGVRTIAGATNFQDTFLAYETNFNTRRDVDAPLRLGLQAALVDDRVMAQAVATAKVDIESDNLSLRLVLFEDDIRFDGGNGVDLHRFTVRAIGNTTSATLNQDQNVTFGAAFDLDPAWTVDRLGVVAFVANEDAQSRAFQAREILQAATFLLTQDGPTIQASRGVLLEYYTATWCPTCVYGDGALDEMANAHGVTSTRVLDRPFEYLRTADPAGLAVAAGIVVAVVLIVPRVRQPPEDDAR